MLTRKSVANALLLITTTVFAQVGPVRVTITPAHPFLSMGQHVQLQATAGFIGNSTAGRDVSQQVTWTSNTNVASIDASGNISTVGLGTTIVVATLGPFHTTTTVTVIPALAVTALVVSPANPSVPKGITKQFAAIATFADNSTQDVTAATSWGSSNLAVARVSGGTANTVGVGSATITAMFAGFSSSSSLTVGPPVPQRVYIVPSLPEISLGLTEQYKAVGVFSDQSTQDLTSAVTWSSSNPAVATVDKQGFASSVLQGSTIISIAYQSLSDSTALAVGPPTLAWIRIQPAFAYVQASSTLQLNVIGTYTDGTARDVSSSTSWGSLASSIASISPSGLFTGLSAGLATITASVGTMGASVTLNVTPPISGPKPVITNISPQPAGYFDQVTINGLNLYGPLLVVFANAVGEPISLNGGILAPDGTSVIVLVPQGAVTGPLHVVTYVQAMGVYQPVESNAVLFQRLARLRIRSPLKDLGAGESVTFQHAFLGDATPRSITFSADLGSFSGDIYTAPASVPNDMFAHITGCITGTQSCDTLLLGLHPFRIAPDVPLVGIGGSLQLTALLGGTSKAATWNLLAGGGAITSSGFYTAGSRSQDGGPALISATALGTTEQVSVGVTGAFPGLVNRIFDYVDQHDSSAGGSYIYGMAVIGDRFYVSASNDLGCCGYFWIDVYDISDPLHPSWITAVESYSSGPLSSSDQYLYSYSASNFAVTGFPGTLTLYSVLKGLPVLKTITEVTGFPVGIVPVANPAPNTLNLILYNLTNGTLNGNTVSLTLPPGFRNPGIKAVGSRMFITGLSNTSTWQILTYDLSTSPATLLGAMDTTFPDAFNYASGNFLFGSGAGGSLDIFDISSPLPQLDAHLLDDLRANELIGTQLLADAGQGCRIVDLSNPQQPKITATLFDGLNLGCAFGMHVGKYVYASEYPGGLTIYDASESGGPVVKARFSSGIGFINDVYDLLLQKPYLYAAASTYSGGGLNVYDMSTNPPALIGQYIDSLQQANALQASSNYLYLGMSKNTAVLDVTQPALPTLVGTLAVPAISFARTANTLFAGTPNNGLAVINITNPAQPVVVLTVPLNDLAVRLRVFGNLLFVADNAAGLLIYDVTLPTSPTLISNTTFFKRVEDVTVAGTTAFIAGSVDGLGILDISNPAQPIILSETTLPRSDPFFYDNPPNQALSVVVNNNIAYVGTATGVVFGLDWTNPVTPRIVSLYAHGASVGSLLFDVADLYAASSNGGGSLAAQVDMSQPFDSISQYFPPLSLQNPAPLNTKTSSVPAMHIDRHQGKTKRFLNHK